MIISQHPGNVCVIVVMATSCIRHGFYIVDFIHDEIIDDFCTRCRERRVKDCEFTRAEMVELIVELVITSISNELFQKLLLENEKRASLALKGC